ncbi:hypothetical protein KCU61_g8314, partial [Aureobasidium melanogenum]
MDINLSKYPKLTKEQLGHLRHIHNLVAQADGEWHHMGTQEPMQEFLDAYRYQLATMAYTLALTHYHHQPALRGVYKPLFRRIIHKMLRREVWGYWFTTSLGGVTTDPSLKELRKPWADPIVRENIMYSGHLLLMISLYAMLFDDDEFEKEGSLVFNWNPLFFGLGPETFTYKTQSLQDAILREMERNGWVGVCCEPNAVFVVCNQFPMIAMRLNDVRHGTSVIDDVLEKYKAAWEKKGMVGPGGLFKDMWLAKQDFTVPANDPGFSAWSCTYMNTWNSKFVRECFDSQALGYLTTIDGETSINPPVVGNAYRQVANEGSASGKEPKEIMKEALEIAQHTSFEQQAKRSVNKPLSLLTKPILGYTVEWLSELGREELPGLLDFIDKNLNPTWEKGGLYYPRNDEAMDKNLKWTHMDPFSGNAAIGYARLNVEDGMKKIWDHPWSQQQVSSQPWLDGISLADDVDFCRGLWDAERKLFIITMRTWDGSTKTLRPTLRNLSSGSWDIFVNGRQENKIEVPHGGNVELEVEIGSTDVDVVARYSKFT